MNRRKPRGKTAIAFVCLTCLFVALVSVVVAGMSRRDSRPEARPVPEKAKAEVDDEPQDDRSRAGRSVAALGFDLYRRLAERPGNLVISPWNLEMVLALASEGALGRTREQMAATLHLAPGGAGHAALGALTGELQQLAHAQCDDAAAPPTQLQLANALWVQRGAPLENVFLSVAQDRYAAHVAEVDFAKAAGDARQTVNRWAAAVTQERIDDLIAEGAPPADTRLLLTSAIYFRGSWTTPFDGRLTAPAAFHLSASEPADVPTMNLRARLRHFRGENLQVLELPYAEGRLAMLVILPKESTALSDVERSLSVRTLSKWTRGLKPAEVMVSLPRFEFGWSGSLKNALIQLGMAEAFGRTADFGGISRQHDLMVSDVVHRAWLAVDEQGSEAAAASAVTLARKGVTDPPVEFRADRPFLFVICDTASGGALFVGRMADPRPSS